MSGVLCEKIRIRGTLCHTGGRRIISKQATIMRTVWHTDSQQKVGPLAWRTLIHAGSGRIMSETARWALSQASLVCDGGIEIGGTNIKTGIIGGVRIGITKR